MNDDWLQQTQSVITDGVSTAVRPDNLPVTQLAWGGNLALRSGDIRSRNNNFIQRATLPKGRVQGAGYFSRDGGQFILSIWGQLWRIRITGRMVTVDSIPLASRNNANRPEAWMCETDGSFLVQDGESDCIIYDGSAARRAVAANNEVPLGRQMAYGNGRLWLVTKSGRQIVAGNIVTDAFQSELLFTETGYLTGGGAFYFKKPLTGLAFLPSNNTNSGFGSLACFGDDYVNTLRAEITARDLWAQIPAFEAVVLPSVGACGQSSIVAVNQDLYFRDKNAQIWSLRSAISDAQGPGNSPISREVSRIVDFETLKQVAYSSGIYFNNRLLWTASPYYNYLGAPTFLNLVSLDVAPTATMRGKANPAYDGQYDGLQLNRVFSGQINGTNRAFAISTDLDGENRLWELVTNEIDDASFMSTGSGNGVTASLENTRVKTYLESIRFDMGAPARKKKLMRLDIWPTEIQGSVDVTVYWRTDNRVQWQLWDSFSMCATMTNEDGAWLDLAAQERGRVKTLTIPDIYDDILKQAQSVGYSFQIWIVWEGAMLIDKIAIWGKPLEETTYSEKPDLPTDCKRNSVVNNVVSYSIPVGGLGEPYNNEDGDVYVDQFGDPYTGPVTVL